ncbi:MAG: hypothetical protein U1C57_02565 [Candidatus Doudnabacteria bacterium]|nr:hypothetical protein [bacterium]MDZ4243965.1 hypothetical protein [Candidatus Doudnabacteria bacterium]
MKIFNFQFSIFKIVLVLIIIVLGAGSAAQPRPAQAITLNQGFGGRVLAKTLFLCLIPAPPPIFTIPIPFQYIVVGPPSPATLYYLFGFSRTYRRHQLEVTALTLGNYIPGLDDLFRKACINAIALPDADGVILKVGTSCTLADPYCETK